MKVRCTNCGADVPIEEQTTVVDCKYCNTGLFVQLDEAIPALVSVHNMASEDGVMRLKGFLKKNEITSSVRIEKVELFFFPFWRLNSGGKKKNLILAISPPVEELSVLEHFESVTIDISDAKDKTDFFVEPELVLQEAIAQAEYLDIAVDESGHSLMHVPFFKISYFVQGLVYTAFVEAVSGRVIVHEMPVPSSSFRSLFVVVIMLFSFIVFVLQTYAIPWIYLPLTLVFSGLFLYRLVTGMISRQGW